MLELLDLQLLLNLLLLLLLESSDLLLVLLDLLLVVLREALLLVLIVSFFDLLLLEAAVDALKLGLLDNGLLLGLDNEALLLFDDLFLLLDLLAEGHSLIIESLLFALLVNLGVLSELDLLVEVLNLLDLVHNLLFTRLLTIDQVLVADTDPF